MSDLHESLIRLHEELNRAGSLAPGDRALLETVLVDIRRALDETPVEPEGQGAHGDALEDAAVRLEAGHPGLAGALRALVDALAKAGI